MTLQFETTLLLSATDPGSLSNSLTSMRQPMKKYGKLVLVDLAGSERLKVSTACLPDVPDWHSCHFIYKEQLMHTSMATHQFCRSCSLNQAHLCIQPAYHVPYTCCSD